MLDIGWQELLIIGAVALVVIGPKDMPVAMRTAARMFAKVRGLSRDFQDTMDDVIRESELDELRRKVKAAGRVNLKDEFTSMVDPSGDVRKDLDMGELVDLEDDFHPDAKVKPAATGTPATPAASKPPPISEPADPEPKSPAEPAINAANPPTAEGKGGQPS